MDLSDSVTRIKLAGASVCLLLALIVGFQLVGHASPLPDRVRFVCVETGELFRLDRDRVVRLPAENPDTGRRTLLPCVQRDDGEFHVSDHYRGSLTKLADANHYVDAETLRVCHEPLAK